MNYEKWEEASKKGGASITLGKDKDRIIVHPKMPNLGRAGQDKTKRWTKQNKNNYQPF